MGPRDPEHLTASPDMLTAFLLSALPAMALRPASSLPVAEPRQPRAAQEESKRDVRPFNLSKDGLALDGFDPVAYFPEGGGKPEKGAKEFEHTYQGVRYRFASSERLDLFKKNPSRFEPAYGGWCAWAMIDGDKVEIDPKSFLVTDGRLFVFYKGLFNDTRAKWQKEPDASRTKADQSWAKIVAKKKDALPAPPTDPEPHSDPNQQGAP